ncbi:MAG TPA: VanZ family protein [Gemmatimonadaceae bacterium]|jgi:glycopeptide antibiotics resistance protein|nr:VanZ family protein [Gemmatimonadaceae bacterium]
MLRHLFYPFLPYRSLFFPILVASAVAAPCWLIFRLYRVRTSMQRVSFSREILLLIFVVYLSGVAAVSLEPNHPSRSVAETMVGVQLRPSVASLTCSSATMPAGSRAKGFCVRNAQGNFLLFLPLGFLLPLVWRRLRFWRAMLIAIGVSCSIELLQLLSRAWGSYRTADINDLVLNGLGTCVGLALGFLLRRSETPSTELDP